MTQIRAVLDLPLHPNRYMDRQDFSFLTGKDGPFLVARQLPLASVPKGLGLEEIAKVDRTQAMQKGFDIGEEVLVEKGEVVGPSVAKLPDFRALTPIKPCEWFNLEEMFAQANVSPDFRRKGSHICRSVNLFCPIGYGSRGLIVADPKVGKTTAIQSLATAFGQQEDVVLMILLVGERPEEVTDFQSKVAGFKNAEVWATTFDEKEILRTIGVFELALRRAMMLAREGKHAVMLVDSITRIARTYNTVHQLWPQYDTKLAWQSGGTSPTGILWAKRYFGSARALVEGGSLTIIGTCLVNTGDGADTKIFQELKGTENMTLTLSADLASKGIYPAIDLGQSSTRDWDLIVPEEIRFKLEHATKLYRQGQMTTGELVRQFDRFQTNAEFLGIEGAKPHILEPEPGRLTVVVEEAGGLDNALQLAGIKSPPERRRRK